MVLKSSQSQGMLLKKIQEKATFVHGFSVLNIKYVDSKFKLQFCYVSR